MKYKIGDKILCTKNRGKMHLAGNSYEILKFNIEDNTITLSIEQDSNRLFNDCDYRLIKKSEKDHTERWLLCDHFMTLKEERRKKLKKLYERRG